MGAAATKFSKLWKHVTGCVEKKAAMFGFDAAGKTTILYSLKFGECVNTIPTVGFNVESIPMKFQTLTIWDLGLRDKMRPLLRHYVTDCDYLILVVDCCDRERIEDVREFMMSGLGAIETEKAKLLIFANKQDLPNAMDAAELMHALALDAVQGFDWHVQPCCAKTGEGLLEGLSFFEQDNHKQASVGGSAAVGQESLGLPCFDGLPYARITAPEDDRQFLMAVEEGQRLQIGTTETLRLAYLHRRHLTDASIRLSFEVAKRAGASHATLTYFWIERLYRIPLNPTLANSLEFLSRHAKLLPSDPALQDRIAREAFSCSVLENPVAALMPMPSDLTDASTAKDEQSDLAFLARVENPEKLDPQEIEAFYALTRLAFVLLRVCESRPVAIKRMDKALRALEGGWQPASQLTGQLCRRPFHETKQYVALQLTHGAMVARPDLASFCELASDYPELCDERCIFDYYSEDALEHGCTEFVVPDRKSLPTKVDVPRASWHQELGDEAFLEQWEAGSLASFGLQSLSRAAYIILKLYGRREGLTKLLTAVSAHRMRPGLSGNQCAHETLAYFMLHMVHFLSSCASWPLQEKAFAAFASSHPATLDSQLYRNFYSEALLFSTEARLNFVLPDLRPLPDLVRASSKSA